jgi:hypothetical protein
VTHSVSVPVSEVPAAPPPIAVSGDLWRQAVEAVRKASPRHGMSLAHGRLLEFKDGQLTIGFSRESGFHRSTVSGNGKLTIEKTLTELLRQPTRINVVDAPAGTATAAPVMSVAEEEAQAKATREKSAEHKVRSHPAVRAALQILGGQIEHIQVLEKETAPRDSADVPEDGA